MDFERPLAMENPTPQQGTKRPFPTDNSSQNPSVEQGKISKY